LLLSSENDESKQQLIHKIFRFVKTEIGKDRESRYLHWERLRHKGLPAGVTNHLEWWYITKYRRSANYRPLPLLSKAHTAFVYWLPDPLQQRLHEIDQQASGRVQIAEEVANPATRDRYLVNSLIEEAITSSQLEGASTTHKVAKAMLRESRPPRDNSERMIFNNYSAMSFVREIADQPLTKDLLLELHRLVTEGTLDDSGGVGRLRRPEEAVAVYDQRDATMLHNPPDANELDQRIAKICDFANSKNTEGNFLHPVIRSIVLHFMIGYDHPFIDGNGRTARALFYWSMARHGYWMMEYISISTILKNAPAKYARSYLYTETDENDVTYFLDFNLSVIVRAITSLQEYLARKVSEITHVEQILGSSGFSRRLNHRQLALLSHALRNPVENYTIERHRKSHNVSYPTARTDLLTLVDLELLSQGKIGNAFIFRSDDQLQQRLEQLRDKFE
jgi:Fic family protein